MPYPASFNGNPLSAEEKRYWTDSAEHGVTLLACNVTVTPIGGQPETVPVLAADTVDAINIAMDILYPDWNTDKPKSGMKIHVEVFKGAL